MLKRALEGVLTEKQSEEVYSAFDQIGDILIIRIPPTLESKKKIIGSTLLHNVKTAKSVFYQTSDVKGDFRVRQLELLAGVNSTKTEYKEYGCRFKVDVEKAFFSPRLSTERERISNLTQDGEILINLFAGIGMFSIACAKKKKCTAYSIDINPIAAKLCEENILINKLVGNVISINKDAFDAASELKDKGDRTLMLLPERSDEFLDSAINVTKDQGVIHYYSHIRSENKTNAAKLSEEHFSQVCKIKSEILGSKVVRAVGPRYYQTVVDVKITK